MLTRSTERAKGPTPSDRSAQSRPGSLGSARSGPLAVAIRALALALNRPLALLLLALYLFLGACLTVLSARSLLAAVFGPWFPGAMPGSSPGVGILGLGLAGPLLWTGLSSQVLGPRTEPASRSLRPLPGPGLVAAVGLTVSLGALAVVLALVPGLLLLSTLPSTLSPKVLALTAALAMAPTLILPPLLGCTLTLALGCLLWGPLEGPEDLRLAMAPAAALSALGNALLVVLADPVQALIQAAIVGLVALPLAAAGLILLEKLLTAHTFLSAFGLLALLCLLGAAMLRLWVQGITLGLVGTTQMFTSFPIYSRNSK